MESLSWLHPYERCLLASSQRNANTTAIRRLCAARVSSKHASLLEGCGLGSTDVDREALLRRCDGGAARSSAWCRDAQSEGRHVCLHLPGMPLHRRSSLLLRRAAANRSAAPGAALLRLLGRGPVHLLGDSIARQIASAARCDVHRAARWNSREARRLLSKLTVTEMGRVSGCKSGCDDDDRHAALVRAASVDLRRRGGGVIVTAMGMHFNSALIGAVDRAGDRTAYQRQAGAVLRALNEFAGSCSECVAVFGTAPTQHFPTEGGEYAAPPVAGAVSAHYPCRALAAGLPAESANSWRAADALRLAGEVAPLVDVLRLDEFTRGAWDAHIGAGGYLQQHSDCTHVCSSPFLWEPAWEGLLASSAATRAPR